MNVNANIITHHLSGILVVPVQAIGTRKIKDTLTESAFTVPARYTLGNLGRVIPGALSPPAPAGTSTASAWRCTPTRIPRAS
jgi:hypothetical protein